MEYESRQVKWYWLLLFILFCGGVVYLLFSGNPYLYSHHELRAALDVGYVRQRSTIPSKPEAPAKIGNPTYQARFNFERTAAEATTTPRSRAYIEYEHHAAEIGEEGFEAVHVAGDDTGFYISGKSELAVAVGMDGKARWKYKFLTLPEGEALLPVLVDDVHAYLIHPAGEVVCLDKASGSIRWVMDLRQPVAAQPFLFQKSVVVPVKGEKNTTGLFLVNRADGQVSATVKKVDVKPGFSVSYSPSSQNLILTADNKVWAVSPEEWNVVWTQTLTDPVRGPAVVVDHQVFVSTLGAKIVKLDSSKKGKVEWETDLEKPAASPPAFLPIMHRLSFLDTSGYLVTVDAKTGKLIWRYGIENRNPLVETWSARLKGNNIEEFKMDWLHKGWTIWSPCSDKRFCIYTPGKGQLIQRVQLSGSPIALPVNLDKRLAFFTQTKAGTYAVSQVVEEGEIKRLKAEAAKASESAQ